MKRLPICLAACACLAVPARAQIDPDPDGIGIYADTGATTVNVTAAVGEIIPVYLTITRPSALSGVHTWACRVVVPDNAQILAWNVPGWSMNVANPPEFIVARGGDPHPVSDIVNIMTFYIRLSTSEPALFYLEGAPLAGSGFDQHPVYLEADDFETPHYLHSYPNGDTQPVFAINAAALAIESESWGGVKALFR